MFSAVVGFGGTLQPEAEATASRCLRCTESRLELRKLMQCNTTHTSKQRVREKGGERVREKGEREGVRGRGRELEVVGTK